MPDSADTHSSGTESSANQPSPAASEIETTTDLSPSDGLSPESSATAEENRASETQHNGGGAVEYNTSQNETVSTPEEVAPPSTAETDAQDPAAARENQAAAEKAEPQVPEAVLPLVAAYEAAERIWGKIIGWNKGGFHVAVDGIPAFCPKSQMEIGNPKRAAAYIDREFEFQIIDIKEAGKRIVVSRRNLLLEDRETVLVKLRERKADGRAVAGKVVSITDFGAFVDLGGIEGLVHLSQLSRKRVEDPREYLQIGQDVQVRVSKIEKRGERISLSMKALEPDPWDGVEERWGAGERFTGKVLRSTDFGLFVELADGLEGLLHSSQLALGKNLDDYPEGTEIEGWIREADGERKRLSLSLREVTSGNPWSDMQDRYSEGSNVTGTVEQIAKFGVFVMLEPGITGLLPFSTLSLPAGANPRRLYRPGQELSVLIDSIDRKKRRISLAPTGSRLEGTRADYRNYQRQQSETGGSLNAMEAAFSKLRQP